VINAESPTLVNNLTDRGARMAMKISHKTLWWTAAGVLIAGATLVVTLRPGGGGHNTTQTQGGSNNVQVGGNLVQQFKDEVQGLTREQAEEAARKYANVPPPVGKPAPYLVVGAPHHLWVRSSGTATGHHIGAAYDGSTVWADCTATTDFDPDGTDDTAAVWLRIHWPTDKPNDNLRNSQPGDRYAGWVYTGQTLPAGHNGAIPTCQNP
jgi:hypothetical protein